MNYKIRSRTSLTKCAFQVEDSELANVIAASTRNNYGVRSMIVEAMNTVERKGVVTLGRGKKC